jgi:hypothetical protein
VTGTAGPRHEERVKLLDSLATLLGATTQLRALPDGKRPDVLRVSLQSRLLFVGEAKDSERATATEAMVRLSHYLPWIVSHARGGGTSILALCCAPRESAAWSVAIIQLAAEAGWPDCPTAIRPMGSRATVVSAAFDVE